MLKKTTRDYVEIYLLLADVAVLEGFPIISETSR